MCTLKLKFNNLPELRQRQPWALISLAVRKRDQVRGRSKIAGMERIIVTP